MSEAHDDKRDALIEAAWNAITALERSEVHVTGKQRSRAATELRTAIHNASTPSHARQKPEECRLHGSECVSPRECGVSAPFEPCVKCFTLEACREGSPCAFGRQDNTPSTTPRRPLPLPDEITAATQLYRAEITKRMETSHPSASPSIESMTITLRDLFEKMEKRGAFAASAMGAKEELEKLRGLINTPEIDLFLRAVHLEAVHQVERWGTTDDRAKRPADWFWLVGYLAGKALHAANGESLPRYRHKKRGGTYEVISVGEDENNRGKSLIVYRGEDDGKIWVRPAEQFFDGRFEELPSKPHEKALHHCISTAAALYNWHCAIKGVDVRMCPGSSDVERIVEAAFPGASITTDGGKA